MKDSQPIRYVELDLGTARMIAYDAIPPTSNPTSYGGCFGVTEACVAVR